MAKKYTLNVDTEAVIYLCTKDKRLAKVIAMVGPIEYDLHEDGYRFLIHEIIEQMLSIKAGAKIYSRLNDLCNGDINPITINTLSDEEIRLCGTSTNKISYIRCLTNAILCNNVSLDDFISFSDQEVINYLTKIKGIGTWTAKMFMIFVLNRENILPYEDVAFLQSYKWLYKTNDVDKKSVEKKCEKWNPYSSIAARFMYRALDMGFTKSEFHLYK